MERKTFVKMIVVMLALLLISGCAQKESGMPKKIQAVATTGMIYDIVKNIGGESIEVVALMGPGVDPHLYKASEGDVSRLSKADIIFYNGLHLEAKLGEIFEQMNKTKRTVPIAEAIPEQSLLSPPEFEGLHDPHIWFDVSLWMIASKEVESALIEIDPKNKAQYEANAKAYLERLEMLHRYVLEKSEQVPKEARVLVTAHDAFNYFGRAYGFEVVGLQGISTAAEAGTKDVSDLAQFIVDRKVKAIFVESSVSERTIKAVEEATKAKGWDVKIGGQLYSDAMGDLGTKEGTYEGMITHNIDTISGALK